VFLAMTTGVDHRTRDHEIFLQPLSEIAINFENGRKYHDKVLTNDFADRENNPIYYDLRLTQYSTKHANIA
jgi:hypothetical protein